MTSTLHKADDTRSTPITFAGVSLPQSLFFRARHATAVAGTMFLFFVVAFVVLFWPPAPDMIYGSLEYWILAFLIACLFWVVFFFSASWLFMPPPDEDLSSSSMAQLIVRRNYWFTDAGHLRSFGSLRIDSDGLSLLIKMPWSRVKAVSKAQENEIIVHKHTWFPTLAHSLRLDEVILRFASAEDANRFLALCSTHLSAL